MTGTEIAAFAASLFAIANPIANLALFEAMTSNIDGADRKQIARTTTVAVIITLVVVTWVGQELIDLFGISIGALEVAGGALLVTVAWSMLHAVESGTRGSEEERQERVDRESIAIVPLTIPIVAGPGTMVTVLVQSHRYPEAAERLEITAVCVGLALVTYVAFRVATPVSKKLGQSGVNVVTRIMGIVLAAIAVGMLTTGLTKTLPGLA